MKDTLWLTVEKVDNKWSISSNCKLCGHDLTNNNHGFDQNDATMKDGVLVHSGNCTYCKMCNPGILELIRRNKGE